MKNKSKNVMYRHGDVILESCVDEVGDEIKREAKGLILAAGELTNHHHRIDDYGATLYKHPKRPDLKLLVVNEPVALRHEEHKPITLPPGKYKVRIKRQYSPNGWERVAD